MRLPPRWLRRLILGPGLVIAAVALVSTFPVFLLLMALGSLIPKYGRLPRVIWLFAFYVIWDAAAVIVMFCTWVASGFGWRIHSATFQRVHYAIAGWFLRVLFRQMQWSLRLKIHYTGVDMDVAAKGSPVIVASRHAGPGDSFILVHSLINYYHRNPRIVLKDSLQWDPAIDTMMNRLPMVFLSPTSFKTPAEGKKNRPSGATERIAEMAETMGPRDALVVFPEGGNFTEERQKSRIQQLEADGYDELASQAAHMTNVLAPRPGGLFAAASASSSADIIFVGHTGLEYLDTAAKIWRALPVDKTIVMRSWQVPAAEIPEGGETEEQRSVRVQWLFDWWGHIDDWIEDTHED